MPTAFCILSITADIIYRQRWETFYGDESKSVEEKHRFQPYVHWEASEPAQTGLRTLYCHILDAA